MRKQLVDAAVQLLGQPDQDIVEVGPRIVPVQLGRLHQAHHELLKLIFDKVESSKMPIFTRPTSKAIAGRAKAAFILPNIRTHWEFMEGKLAGSEWFAGDQFSGVDIQMSFPVEAARARGGLDASRPRLLDYLARIQARPGLLARAGARRALRVRLAEVIRSRACRPCR